MPQQWIDLTQNVAIITTIVVLVAYMWRHK